MKAPRKEVVAAVAKMSDDDVRRWIYDSGVDHDGLIKAAMALEIVVSVLWLFQDKGLITHEDGILAIDRGRASHMNRLLGDQPIDDLRALVVAQLCGDDDPRLVKPCD